MVTIRGDVKRKDEIIKWLEDLGGCNRWNMSGHDEKGGYYINDSGDICCSHSFNVYMPLTLDEFKSKYPFKLNEWVFEKKDPSYVFNISKIKFKYDKIVYEGRNKNGDVITYDTNQLNQLESLPIHAQISGDFYYTYNGDFGDNSKLCISSDISKVEFPNDLEIDKIENNIIHFKKRES